MWPQLQQWWDVRKWRQISLPLKTKVFFLLLRLLQPPSEANLDIRLRFNVPRVKTLWKSVEAQIGGEQRSSIASCHRSLSAEIPRWTWAAMFRLQIDHILHCVNCLFVFFFFFLVENDITVPAYCFLWCLLLNRRTITFVLIHNVALYWSVLLNSDPDQNFLAVSFGFHHNLLFLFKISLSSESKKVKKTHHLCSRRVEHHLLPKFESF